jgi:hypothetical protein
LTVTGSTLSSNYAGGPHQGNGLGGGICNRGTLTVTGSTLSGNRSAGGSGGIFNSGTATVTDSTLRANTASYGDGGIGNDGTLTVTRSTLEANSSGLSSGGAIGNSGTLTLTGSSLTANSVGGNSSGGGIVNSGTLTVTGSTLSGNHAISAGGGISNHGTVTVTNSTLSANSASVGVGGISNSATLTLGNTIVAGNSSATDGSDASGGFTSLRYNLVRITDGSTGWGGNDLTGTASGPLDPMLGTLGDQGGPTWTIPLLAGSPALNAGDPALLGTADQREAVRGGGVHVGAFQASAAVLVLTAPAPATTGVPFDVSVAVYDIFGQLAVGYTGTIHFSTTDGDPNVVLPPDYTFQPADGGLVTFSGGVTLFTPGAQTLTATDLDSGLADSVVVTL